MKEQFLNLTGLTELVGYLKTSIANHKEILPYASNKLFPSVGDINTIYIILLRILFIVGIAQAKLILL